MELIRDIISFILHIDKHLDQIVATYGSLTYLLLCLIVFLETGLVVTPFLPGDSLLFAAGAIASRGLLNPHILFLILAISAIIGDLVNYMIGTYFGEKILSSGKFIKKEHLDKTERYFSKYGSKTIVFARFVPIVRTIAPFMAGLGKMEYRKFGLYNIVGGVVWVFLFIYAGYIFGQTEWVKKNFVSVILMIIIISCIPPFIEWFKERKKSLIAA